MFLFCLKKNFCDGWDNIFLLLVVNLLIVILAMAAYFAIAAAVIHQALMLAGFVLFLCVILIPVFAFGSLASRVAAFKSVTMGEFFAQFARVWKDAVRFALIIAALVIIGVVALPFYLRMGTLLGIALGAVIFWFFLISVMAFQWFIPLRFLMNDSFLKSLKKSYIIFFDNTAFSVCYFFYQLALIALSVIVFFLLPSFAGIVLAQTNALRLMLYKYDWFEANPQEAAKKKRHIPWDELLAEDRESLGPRSLRSFIFPWKD
ncbi:MAG: hypothetical protein LBS97_05065 [Treponema sp.]|jgi:hypothetical protein|nr:hypothetical protein [Treponema sp.]